MHSDILSVFKQLVEVQKTNFTLLEPPYHNIDQFDLGLRKTIYQEYSFLTFLDFLNSQSNDSILYHYLDKFQCNYTFFQLESEDKHNPSYIIIGPYLTEEITTNDIFLILEKINFPKSMENEIREYYNAIPVFLEITRFHSMLSIMAAQVLDAMQPLTMKFINPSSDTSIEQTQYRLDSTPTISSKMIEDRYKAENELLIDISQGNASKAQISFHNFLQFHITTRFKDPVRHIKNLTIVLNTLLRKAVESSNVHPIHIDEVSRDFAIRIEGIRSLNEVDALQTAMIRKYCMLVTNHSLSGYSPFIQKVINYIDMNLSESLSLRQIAEEFSINSSYLSTLFKKEMEITITDFITQQKIRYAIALLNKTDAQIQNIASQVGINDVNYFIKVFKKITGMTPKEYRDSIKDRKNP